MTDLDSLEVLLARRIYRLSYYEFFKDAFAQLHPGNPYDDNWHIEYLCGQLQEEFERMMIRREPRKQDILINMPFRAAKSLIVTVIFPVWCWTLDATTKFITVSYAERVALKLSTLSRTLMFTPWFKRYFPDLVLKENRKEYYDNTKGGYRLSAGTGGGGTHEHERFLRRDFVHPFELCGHGCLHRGDAAFARGGSVGAFAWPDA